MKKDYLPPKNNYEANFKLIRISKIDFINFSIITCLTDILFMKLCGGGGGGGGGAGGG